MEKINSEQQKEEEEEDRLILPPGFRFHPTDEEIITRYLSEKAANPSFSAVAMGEVDLNKCEPWDLPSRAKMGEKEWYFFFQKERRYPTGMRTNRATASGYWKATGKDKEIHTGSGVLVGMKKTLVFYMGRAPRGEKTNWVMHEFRLDGNYSHYFNLPTSSRDNWVVVRVFHKNDAAKKNPLSSASDDQSPWAGEMAGAMAGCPSTSYLQRDEALAPFPFISQNKLEQFSSSMMSTSRETGLSNDWNAEISSYDFDGPSSGHLFDLKNIWDY